MEEPRHSQSECAEAPPWLARTLHSAEGAVLALRQHSTLPVGESHREAKSWPSAQWRGLERRQRGQLTKGTEAGAVGGKGAGELDPSVNTVGAGWGSTGPYMLQVPTTALG